MAAIGFPDSQIEEIVRYESMGRHNSPIFAIQVDPEHKRLYWCDGNSFHPAGALWSANLEGDDVKLLVDKRQRPRNLVVDPDHGQLYLIEGLSQTGALMTCDIHGRNVTTIVDGLKSPFGLAIDLKRSELFYFEEHRIIRIKTGGTEETLVVNTVFKTGVYAYAMDYNSAEDRLYWDAGNEQIRSVHRDGSGFVESVMQVSPMGNVTGFALEERRGKFYFLNSTYGRVERANLDGTQREVIVTFPDEYAAGFGRGTSRGVAVDPVRRQLYFAGGKGKGTTDHPRIYRIGLPLVLTPRERPAPPIVAGVRPAEFGAGDEITIVGRFLGQAAAVTFIDNSTCWHSPARFRVIDDGTLTVSVPELTEHCTQPVIIVRTPSGVTATLRKNLRVLKPQQHYEYDRFVDGRLGAALDVTRIMGCIRRNVARVRESRMSFCKRWKGNQHRIC